MKSEKPEWWKLLDNVRDKTQRTVDKERSKHQRNIEGQHATPFGLALEIMKTALSYVAKPFKELCFLEPAIGLGVFYSCFLEATNGIVPKRALGFEKDPQLAAYADAFWSKTGLTTINEDFTKFPSPDKEDEKFDLVVTNPPYVRHHHIKQEKQRLLKLVSQQLNLKPTGLMGLYGYFLLITDSWMKKGGIGAWLVPREFMAVNYGSVIREYLTERVELLRVHCFDLDDVIFDDADVSSAVIFLRNRTPIDTHKVAFTYGSSMQTPIHSVSATINSLRNLKKWSALEKIADQAPITKDANIGVQIGELFDVKRGLATGANDFFIMTAAKAEALKIPERFLVPILPSPKKLGSLEVIESDEHGMPNTRPFLLLLNCSLSKGQLRSDFPNLYGYIHHGEEKGLHRRYLTSRREPWYKQEVRQPAPILCSYMGRKRNNRTIKFYRNKSSALATNAYHMLYPKTQSLVKIESPVGFCDIAFAAMKNLDYTEISLQGRAYGGGLYKIEPGELEQVTLPENFRNFIKDDTPV